MALTIGVKRVVIDGATIQTKTASTEYKPSGSTKTPILDDASGKVMGATRENTAGMIKLQVSALRSADTEKLRYLDGSTITLETVDGKTIAGQNMIQTADNPVVMSDGIIEYEFMGDVKVV